MARWGRRLISGGCALALVALTVFIGVTPQLRKRIIAPKLVLPPAEELTEMRASLRGRPAFGQKEVSEFVVPLERVPLVLRWVQPARYTDPSFRTFPDAELGQINIRTKAGTEISVRFYDFGKNPAVLTLNGVDYFWAQPEHSESGRGWDGGLNLIAEIEAASGAAHPQP